MKYVVGIPSQIAIALTAGLVMFKILTYSTQVSFLTGVGVVIIMTAAATFSVWMWSVLTNKSE